MTKQELLDFIDTTGVVRVKDLALKFHLSDPEARADLRPLLNQGISDEREIGWQQPGREPSCCLARLSEGDERNGKKLTHGSGIQGRCDTSKPRALAGL